MNTLAQPKVTRALPRTWSAGGVMWMRRACVVSSLVAGMLLSMGCVDVNGGAVEVSWTIQRSDGTVVACGAAGVKEMRLRATPVAGGEAVTRTWDCGAGYGASAFDLAVGSTSFVLEPQCLAAGETFVGQVPAPIVRNVTEGQVVSLNALLVVGDADGKVCQNVP